MDIEKKQITPDDNNENNVNSAEENVIEETGKDIAVTQETESTIFTKSNLQTETKKTISSKKKRLITVISMLLAVCVIAGAAFLIYKFVKDDDSEATSEYSIKVKVVKAEKVNTIDIKNSSGEYTIVKKVNNTSSDTTSSTYSTDISWYIKNLENPLIADSSVGTVADACLSIYATREMKDKSLDYGFDKPFATVKVNTADNLEDYTLTFGNKAPDGTGYYLKVTGDEKIYLATVGTVQSIDFKPEKLANTVIVETPGLDDNTLKEDKKYYDDDGAISTFDYIELSGSEYNGEKIIITPIENNDMAKFFVETSKGKRYADEDNCNKVFGIITNGLVAIDTYKLSPTAEDIKNYKLDNPEYTVKIKYGTTTVSLKASMYDTEKKYYATIVEGRDAIYAMSADALDMIGFEPQEFYNDYVFLEYYNSFSKVSINTPNGNYVFNTEYNENAEDDKFTVTANNKKVDDDLFTAYYQHIVTLKPEAEENYIKSEPTYTATFKFTDTTRKDKTLTLSKQSDRRYLVTVDGIDMGIVSSSVYDHLVEYVDYILNGKEIPEP